MLLIFDIEYIKDVLIVATSCECLVVYLQGIEKGERMKIAINGFGRIGKTFFRVLLDYPEIQKYVDVVAINVGYGDPERIAHTIRYDSTMPTYDGDITYRDGYLSIGPFKHIAVFACVDFDSLNWTQYDVDYVVDCSGQCTQRKTAQKHRDAGAKKVVISAPAEHEDISVVMGVNDHAYHPDQHNIISLGSCTTYALLPTLKVLHDAFGVEYGFMTTTHAYTNSQVLLDETSGCDKVRRQRSAPNNIIPTTTGASSMVGKILPEIGDRIHARAIRVPVPNVSIIDLVVTTRHELTRDAVHNAFKQAAQGDLHGVLNISDEPCVSTDYSGTDQSVTIDTLLTQLDGNSAKIFGWYDNEWGYSARMRDFILTCCT